MGLRKANNLTSKFVYPIYSSTEEKNIKIKSIVPFNMGPSYTAPFYKFKADSDTSIFIKFDFIAPIAYTYKFLLKVPSLNNGYMTAFGGITATSDRQIVSVTRQINILKDETVSLHWDTSLGISGTLGEFKISIYQGVSLALRNEYTKYPSLLNKFYSKISEV